jgi:hemerythrin
LKWLARYSTGVEQIDTQHQMLFQMSEDYRQALEEGRGERVYGLILESLEQYCRGHFGLEEQCMLRYQCPVAEANSAAHRQFETAMAGFRQRFADAGFNVTHAEQLVDYIDDWLASHIMLIDTKLKPCVENATRPKSG